MAAQAAKLKAVEEDAGANVEDKDKALVDAEVSACPCLCLCVSEPWAGLANTPYSYQISHRQDRRDQKILTVEANRKSWRERHTISQSICSIDTEERHT